MKVTPLPQKAILKEGQATAWAGIDLTAETSQCQSMLIQRSRERQPASSEVSRRKLMTRGYREFEEKEAGSLTVDITQMGTCLHVPHLKGLNSICKL